jgi:uncharacterized DUF497 family protein
MAVIYEWDRNKAKANVGRHGITSRRRQGLWTTQIDLKISILAMTVARTEVWSSAATRK